MGRTQELTWPRATLWKTLGEHRVNLVAGAQVLIEKERFHDSYMRLPAGA